MRKLKGITLSFCIKRTVIAIWSLLCYNFIQEFTCEKGDFAQ